MSLQGAQAFHVVSVPWRPFPVWPPSLSPLPPFRTGSGATYQHISKQWLMGLQETPRTRSWRRRKQGQESAG